MSTVRHHADWLSLVEVSGPFVSLPVLLRAFPQGLEPRDPAQAKQLRSAYEEWQDHPTAPGKQRAWVLHVLCELLGYPVIQIAEGQSLPAGLEANMAEQGETLRPDFALIGPASTEAAGQAQLLICSYPADQPLDKPVIGKHWKATPATRMMELLHGTNVPLGLVANGEQWMLVYAPRGETTGYASWYGALWLDEPITLRAFQSLLGVRRFFGVAADSTLLALLKESASDQQEVTDQLGYQVREAVEVLVQSFDAIHQESQGAALKSIPPTAVYDAALTIMMRLVFLFSAEERGLLHLGKPLYDDNYAVSTLQEQLQEVADRYGEEVLERRYDAWARLLASFRAVHGGIQHQDLLMQAYGGSLFDPDRYPFLEGRAAGSSWRSQPADPLPVNNRVVLHLLNSLQRLRTKAGGAAETRRVSFRALGVEQIGHVYEGLLDHTAQRATEVVLGIRGTRNKEPEIPLHILEQLLAKGEDELLEHLKEETGRSLTALRKELNNASALEEHKLLVSCRQDEVLLARLRPFAGLIREDSFERPWVVLPGSVFVTAGTTRRSTGTHYTPPSLTEPIVRNTLEPLVYVGPTEGLPRDEWKLKSPKEILALKVCDMAMGSGAFLVQACRYLAERLVEAWENEEKAHPGQVLITPEGNFSEGDPTERLVPAEAAERIAIARRVVADRCLYGVDINPMAVEMAKLSMWLITVDKTRPFTFLDHALKSGDSLIGITSMEQLENFSLRPGGVKQQAFSMLDLRQHIEKSKMKRETLEEMTSDTPAQILSKAALYVEAEAEVFNLCAAGDILVGTEMRRLSGAAYESMRQLTIDQMISFWTEDSFELKKYAAEQVDGRAFVHWPLQFPEIMSRGGFDAFVGNPPFMGGWQMPTYLGPNYCYSLKSIYEDDAGTADLVAYFFRRAFDLLKPGGFFGLIGTKSIAEAETRKFSLDYITRNAGSIYKALPQFVWPGAASVVAASVHVYKGDWKAAAILGNGPVSVIPSTLTRDHDFSKIFKLKNQFSYSQGTMLYGNGFVRSRGDVEKLISENPGIKPYLRIYVNGDTLNHSPDADDGYVCIDFGELNPNEIDGCHQIIDELSKIVGAERSKQTRQIHEHRPWLHWDKRTSFYMAARALQSVLALTIVSKHLMFIPVDPNKLFSHGIKLFLIDRPEIFGVLQSTIHAEWANVTSSKLGAAIRYSTSGCFDTFPFPEELAANTFVKDVASEYLKFRFQLTEKKCIGPHALYDLLHSEAVDDEEIINFRELHRTLDNAVVTAYGWHDIDLGHAFYKTKQGSRFTISEDARRELLDRLLSLNHQRYAEEVGSDLGVSGLNAKRIKKRKVAVNGDHLLQEDMFNLQSADRIPHDSPSIGPSRIVDYLRANHGWHSKDDIITATGFPDSRWNVAIRELLDSGQVNRQGEKRGSKYSLAGTQD